MHIEWPSQYSPTRTRVHVRNRLVIETHVESIWPWLIRAALWPTWYPNSANVTFLTGTGPDLALGTRFRWKTFGVTIESVVLEFVPPTRIAWDAHAFGIDAYHGWVIQGGGETVSKVLTEESQNGWFASLGNTLMPNRMHRQHQIWLEALRASAVSGLPPMPLPKVS